MCCSHDKLKVILVIVSFFSKLSTSQTIYNYTSSTLITILPRSSLFMIQENCGKALGEVDVCLKLAKVELHQMQKKVVGKALQEAP